MPTLGAMKPRRRWGTRISGLGQFNGVIESSLNSGLIGVRRGDPSDGDAGEGFGDEKSVPGADLPRAMRVDINGSNRAIDKFRQLNDAGLGNLGRASGAIGGDGAVIASEIGALQVA